MTCPKNHDSNFNDKPKPTRKTLKMVAGEREGNDFEFRKRSTLKVVKHYSTNYEYFRLGERVLSCCNYLNFIKKPDDDKWKFYNAYYCGVRTCPACMAKRSAKLRARLFQISGNFEAEGLGLIFLTLTVKNCDIQDLRETLKMMNAGFSRLRKKKNFEKICVGFIKSTEVTRSKNGQAHPHFHVILAVKKSYFKSRDYIKHSEWLSLWKNCCRLDYDPVVGVQKIKAHDKQEKTGALLEVSKYTTKVDQMIDDCGWFLEYSKQITKLRFFDVAGIFRDLLKELDKKEKGSENSIEESILAGDTKKLTFFWDYGFDGYISEWTTELSDAS